MFPFQDAGGGGMPYPGGVMPNGMGVSGNNNNNTNQSSANDSISSDAAAAAAVAAVAHGIRQQMQMVAAQHHPETSGNLVGGLNHLNMYPNNNNGGSANNIPMPKIGSPATSGKCLCFIVVYFKFNH